MAVILAGGDGSRLSGLVRNMTGHNVPKQFCSLLGDVTLLEHTRRRVEMAIEPDKTVFVVNQSHEQHYAPILRDVSKSNLVVQPEDRGTGPAILLALLRTAALVPDASVALFPAHHVISDEREFMRHVEIAFQAVEDRPEFTVLLAMEPSRAGGACEWIEPAQRIGLNQHDLYRVAGLWDKSHAETSALLKRGWMWNSGVTIARLSTLLGMIMVTAPRLYAAFAPLRERFPRSPSPRMVASVYQELPVIAFSRHVLR